MLLSNKAPGEANKHRPIFLFIFYQNSDDKEIKLLLEEGLCCDKKGFCSKI